MKSLIGCLVALVMALNTAGCATVLNSEKSGVTLTSIPSGARVFVDEVQVGATPLVHKVSVARQHTVVFRADGHEDGTCEIGRKVGAEWVILDLLLFWPATLVDAATESWYELDRSDCGVTLRPTARGGLLAVPYPPAFNRFNSRSRSRKLFPSVIQDSAGSPFR